MLNFAFTAFSEVRVVLNLVMNPGLSRSLGDPTHTSPCICDLWADLRWRDLAAPCYGGRVPKHDWGDPSKKAWRAIATLGRQPLIDHHNLEAFADPVDYDRQDTSDTGVAFYAALAQETGGPVLEIACGTGRDAIKNNEKVSNCGRRFWELTGGVLRCAACGGAMATNYITPRKTGYYRCGKRYRLGVHACPQGKNFRAEETEAVVWEFVSSILKDPERLWRGLQEMVDRERTLASRAPGEDEEGWLKKLSELEVQEERLLDLYLEGKLEPDRYESRVSQLKRSRQTVEQELEHIRNRTIRIERLEQDRDTLLSHYSQIAVEHLDRLQGEERNRVYKMLDLEVLAHENSSLEVKWALGGDLCRDNEPLPPGSSRTLGR
jgi:hypothetical protein